MNGHARRFLRRQDAPLTRGRVNDLHGLRLLEIAERSRRQSAADLMVANTLEGASFWALLGPLGGTYERVSRRELAPRLLEALERLHGERSHG